MGRTTKIVAVSLPPGLLKDAEKVAREEHRTTSELFREALRRYMNQREHETARRDEARRRLFQTVEKTWERTRKVAPEIIEQEVQTAIDAVRRGRRAKPSSR